MNSNHWTKERINRNKVIKEIGEGTLIKKVTIDRGHKNGPEVHCISDTGIITIYNANTHKMVTKLIARPGQIKRYYSEGETVPKALIELATLHQKMSYNYM